MIVTRHADSGSIAVGQSLPLVFSERFGCCDLEHEFRSGVRCVCMLAPWATGRPEAPDQFSVGKHEPGIDDDPIWPRLVKSHESTIGVERISQ